MKLTSKQSTFCDEYMIDLNATQAAIRAGYSEKCAGTIGQENMQKLAITTRLEELQVKRRVNTEITAENVLRHISKIAFDEDKHDNSRLKGLEMLSKNLSLFQNEVIEANITISITNYSDGDSK